MSDTTITSFSLSDTQQIALNFANALSIGDVVVFNGDLGVGKTEFIRAICEAMDVSQVVTSPTFTIINQYEGVFRNNDITIFHIDLYRINKADELLELGFSELFDTPNALFFIEWAENAFGMLPEYQHKVTITPRENETERIIEINRD
ncbi:MAG: tRNA (adenosine(37)-N6)-threonylcarbamoyltransferase complex ATPase subunit type 1 TsaE [Ignavibacteria bacterium]|jgi:tRNA threonylcarbamoyladenosine biosynthesis protein TsaE|nr:tRNA (adenosine(37)-N6)-threonylcarbamoyltransferase complex ATPase subunit type 1 TsaE [Ignavibacteria bacterium]